MKKGKLFVISGPSGVGKDTIVNEYLKENDAHLSVSATTRNPREGEIHGIHYYFYTNEEFERDEVHGKIIEQIQMFKKQKKEWEKELKDLMPQAGISEKIDSKIIELDSKIEKSIDGRSALSDELKRELKSDKLMSLMEKIEQILNEE